MWHLTRDRLPPASPPSAPSSSPWLKRRLAGVTTPCVRNQRLRLRGWRCMQRSWLLNLPSHCSSPGAMLRGQQTVLLFIRRAVTRWLEKCDIISGAVEICAQGSSLRRSVALALEKNAAALDLLADVGWRHDPYVPPSSHGDFM